MNSATVVQAGGSAGHPFEAAPHLPPEEEVPLDFQALRARLSDVLTRADEMLSQKGELATEQGLAALSDLSQEIGDFSCALSWAIPARDVLEVVQREVVQRAMAALEVCDVPADERGDLFLLRFSNGTQRGLLNGCKVPERWQQALAAASQDIPF